jgi:hypothetical protein
MPDADIQAIRDVIAAQFRSLRWSPGQPADWAAFRASFLPDTTLIPAARPPQRQSVDAFIARLQKLEAEGKLASFSEKMLAATIQVFGNVAVAFGTCEMLENNSKVTRDVSPFLFVKRDRQWRIAAQAWDLETDTLQIPAHFMKPAS